MKEDYCNFEIAKLLKEKGFDWGCYKVYNTEGVVGISTVIEDVPTNYKSRDYYFLCPTLQMAMKWLRERYNIHIEIRYQGNKEYSYKYYINNLKADKEDNKHKFFGTHYMQPINENKTYESACESAIEYCLENLI